jgi:hypothetical protein
MAIHSSVRDLRAALPARRDWVDQALVFGGVFAVLMAASPKLLGDPDTQWHIATGAFIWRTGQVPWTDPFSHTFAGQPWIAKEWLSQLILFAAKSAAGWTGVVVVAALSISLVLALLYEWLAERCRSTVALILTLVAGILLAPHFLARPHVFALLPLFLWTRGLTEALDRERRPPIWLIPVLVLWANLHGSFTIAYPIAGILALEAILGAPAGRRGETVLTWAAFGLLAVAAGCATPYGVHALLVTFTVFGSGESLPFIDEWQPVGWGLAGILSVGSSLALCGVLAVGGRRNLARIALLALLTGLLVRHTRFVDVFAIVAPVVAAVPLVRCFPGLAPEPADPASRWPLYARAALAFLAAASLAALPLRRPEPPSAVAPRGALAAARAAGLSGPVANAYNFGGFLIAEGVPTFIDGRTDQLFLGGFISGLYAAVQQDEPDALLRAIAPYGVTWAIVESGSREARHFERAPGWSRLYRDDAASVYAKELRGSLL